MLIINKNRFCILAEREVFLVGFTFLTNFFENRQIDKEVYRKVTNKVTIVTYSNSPYYKKSDFRDHYKANNPREKVEFTVHNRQPDKFTSTLTR